MLNKNKLTAADFALRSLLPVFSSPEKLPLTFKLNGEKFHGISEVFPSVTEQVTVSSVVEKINVSGINAKGLEVASSFTEYKLYPAAKWDFCFINRSRKESDILSEAAITFEIKGSAPELEYGNGDTRDEAAFSRVRVPLEEDITVKPIGGRGAEGASPYFTLYFGEYAVKIAVGWLGNWFLTAHKTENGVEITVGQSRCNMRLHPLEKICLPSVTLLVFEGSAERGVNLWRRWFREYIMPRESDGTKLAGRMFLHTFEIGGTEEFTGITQDNQLAAIEEYERKGLHPDCWWIDAGWYSCEHRWVRTGDWYPNPEQLPDGFRPIADKLHENNTDLLLWFEPERVYENTRFEYQHPEWLLSCKTEEGATGISSLVNYSDPECLKFIIELLDGIIKTSGVDIYRQDFNFDPLPHWENNETAERIGAIENGHVQGVWKLFDELRRRNPGLLIDICAAGGTRNDIETLSCAVPLQYTDTVLDNPPVRLKQYREMFSWMPYFRAHTMSGDDETGKFVHKKRPTDEYAWLCAFTPAVTCMLDYDAPEHFYGISRKYAEIWRKASECELDGDFYPLHIDNNDGWYAVQFDCPEKNSGFIEVIRHPNAPEAHLTVLPFIHNDCRYTFVNASAGEEKHADGAGIVNGLSFYMASRSGEVWFYTYQEK